MSCIAKWSWKVDMAAAVHWKVFGIDNEYTDFMNTITKKDYITEGYVSLDEVLKFNELPSLEMVCHVKNAFLRIPRDRRNAALQDFVKSRITIRPRTTMGKTLHEDSLVVRTQYSPTPPVTHALVVIS